MRGRLLWAGRTVVCLGLLAECGLAGCAVVDPFGSRVDIYNQEAADSKSRLLVLNVVRDAYGQPLEFSTLSTVLGTASAGGGLITTLPIVRGTSEVSYVFAPSLTGSGGPQFNVSFLDTKEFMAGIQAPVTIQAIASLNTAFPLEVLLPLLLSSIDFQAPNGTPSRIENSGEDRYKFRLFNSAIRQLVNHGLSTEPLSQPVGPLMPASALGTPRAISDAATAGLTMQKYTVPEDFGAKFDPQLQLISRELTAIDPNLTIADLLLLKSKKEIVYYRSFMATPAYRFCFDQIKYYRQQQLISGVSSSSAVDIEKKIPEDGVEVALFPGNPNAALKIYPRNACSSTDRTAGKKVSLTWTPRSVAGVIDYLGQIARLELGLRSGAPDPGAGPVIQLDPRGEKLAKLFTITRGTTARPRVSITSESNEVYSVPIDPTGGDLSGTVLRILSELITSNSSAKDLPVPGVISVIAP